MIALVLSRGVRVIDLEIYLVDGQPVVAFSKNGADSTQIDPSSNPVANFDSKNSIPLKTAFGAIVSNAFNSSSVPNASDPLFVNMRIRSTNPSIYSLVAGVVKTNLSGLLYKDNIGSTTIGSAKGKIVLMVDNTIDPNILKNLNQSNLANHIAIYTGNNTGEISIYRDYVFSDLTKTLPQITSMDKKTVNRTSTSVVYPTVNSTNPDVVSLAKGWGMQLVCLQYHLSNDPNLVFAESSVFTSSAFVPLATVLQL
jgi:hypothetical protein